MTSFEKVSPDEIQGLEKVFISISGLVSLKICN